MRGATSSRSASLQRGTKPCSWWALSRLCRVWVATVRSHYSVYPGEMRVDDVTTCEPECGIQPITGTALALDD